MSFRFFTQGLKPEPAGTPSKEFVILVEGKDDGCFLEAALNLKGANPESVQVISVSGCENMWPYIQNLKKSSFFKSGNISGLAVILDADSDFEHTEAGARGHLASLGFPIGHSSEVAQFQGVRVGLFLLPNSELNGELEDLILDSFGNDRRVSEAVDLLNRFDETGEQLKKPAKRKMQIALAVSPTELCAGVGMGIRRGAFDLKVQHFSKLGDFLDDFLE